MDYDCCMSCGKVIEVGRFTCDECRKKGRTELRGYTYRPDEYSFSFVCEKCSEYFDNEEDDVTYFGYRHKICEKCMNESVTLENILAYADEECTEDVPSGINCNPFVWWLIFPEIGRLVEERYKQVEKQIYSSDLADFIADNTDDFAEFICKKIRNNKKTAAANGNGKRKDLKKL